MEQLSTELAEFSKQTLRGATAIPSLQVEKLRPREVD